MLIAGVPLIVCVVGLLLWALAQNAIVKEAGRIMFAFGLLVCLFMVAAGRVHVP